MSSKTYAWPALRRALDQGDAQAARAAASEMPHVPLSEALELVVVIARAEPNRLPRYALAWHGRFCRELRDVRPDEAQAVLALLTMLSGPKPRDAAAALGHLLGSRTAIRYAVRSLLELGGVA